MEVLKFAVGVRKGMPLESVNLPYRIGAHKGEEVAIFQNGSMARFYRDQVPDMKPKPDLITIPVPIEDTPSFIEPVKVGPVVRLPYPRKTIGKFISADGVYCVIEDGHQMETYSRDTVGSGLREYLWLYEKFREFGRGRFRALFEARSIYFL